jgi:hypothetical protein
MTLTLVIAILLSGFALLAAVVAIAAWVIARERRP